MSIKHLFLAGLLAATAILWQEDYAIADHELPHPGAPTGNVRLIDFSPTLLWDYQGRATKQYHLQLVPINNDGPGLDLIRPASCCGADGFKVLAPPDWYGLLPDQTYSWHLRISSAPGSIGANDPSWSGWTHWSSFKTPVVSSRTIKTVRPVHSSSFSSTVAPTLTWDDTRTDVYYYEVQLSADSKFNTDPGTATAAVYWNLVHGGVAEPKNSWVPPTTLVLPPNQTYFWRVRPRIQGDGTPLEWSAITWFTLLP